MMSLAIGTAAVFIAGSSYEQKKYFKCALAMLVGWYFTITGIGALIQ